MGGLRCHNITHLQAVAAKNVECNYQSIMLHNELIVVVGNEMIIRK